MDVFYLLQSPGEERGVRGAGDGDDGPWREPDGQDRLKGCEEARTGGQVFVTARPERLV